MDSKSQGNIFLPLLIVIVIVVLGLFGYFFLKSKGSSVTPTDASQLPAGTNCTAGFDGNTGDNFCSNYHETSSKCLPNNNNIYSDGCSKP